MREFQVNDFVKWLERGMNLHGRIVGFDGRYAVVELDSGDTENVALHRLSYLEPIRLNKNEFRSLVRLECDVFALFADNYTQNLAIDDGYEFTVEDVFYTLERVACGAVDEERFNIWRTSVCPILWAQCTEDSDEVYTDADVLVNTVMELGLLYNPSLETVRSGLTAFLEEAKIFLEDRKKPMLERRYADWFMEAFLCGLNGDELLNTATEKEVELYRHFATVLAAKDNFYGLRAVGYGCYGGDRAFECDFTRSRDCILKLYKTVNQMPAKAFYANTLGYIYYYGRCTDGVPDYESAYKYFSFAAFNGIYEARYKVADMFKNGYAVEKSVETARSLISSLYDENLDHLKDGSFKTKFADVALRMGSLEEELCDNTDDGYGVAIHYYTLADFAIRMRMMESDYYGDASVAERISEALQRVKEKDGFFEDNSTIHPSIGYSLTNALGNGRLVSVVIKMQKNGTYKMTFAPLKRGNEEYRKKMLVEVFDIGVCGLYEKYSAVYTSYQPLDDSLLDRPIVFDEADGDGLHLYGKTVVPLDGFFTLRRSGFKGDKANRFVTVTFGGNETVDDITDDESIAVGDKVLVDDSQASATVVRVTARKESETPFVIKEYGRVLSRA